MYDVSLPKLYPNLHNSLGKLFIKSTKEIAGKSRKTTSIP